MSERYRAFMLHGDPVVGDGDSEQMHMSCDEIADRMNKLQRVVDAAEEYMRPHAHWDSRPGGKRSNLIDSLEALKPKTPEQLLDDLLRAADRTVNLRRPLNVSESRSVDLYEYESAKKAYRDSLK
ncbi:hypothetical protein [uncultured Paraglaciecola sp.]|uniref:hypothetical protein n=1 Tax=uncultured Paraglaciecola sp. TaxID=1765024 RepID=UPI0026183234|nr:hypothetical protein [uncultured Paraglaciecola sp.]